MLLPKNNFLKYQVYQSDIEELPNWEICVAMPDFGHTQFQSWQRQHTNIKDFFIPSKFNCEKIAYQSFARAKKLHLCFAADGRWPLQLHKCIIVKIFDAQHFPIRFLIASHSSPHSYSDSYVYRRGKTTFSFNFFSSFFSLQSYHSFCKLGDYIRPNKNEFFTTFFFKYR